MRLSSPAPTSVASSEWLPLYLYILLLVSGLWAGTAAAFPLAWLFIAAVTVVVVRWRFELPRATLSPVTRSSFREIAFAGVVSAPALFYLSATWLQEFPYGGDQAQHNANGLEAREFWQIVPWIVAVGTVPLLAMNLRRGRRWVVPVAIAGLALIGMLWSPLSFAGRYPGSLHFFAVPLRMVLDFVGASPLSATRLLNVAAIPAWLLLLRPHFIGRRLDPFSCTIALFLFWQKDDVYYFSSGYLEPWGVVLVLTAAEHLLRFGSDAVWRPLLLIGGAAMIKEQMVLSLPIVTVMFFPFREEWRARYGHLAGAAVAIAPIILFIQLRGTFKVWGGVKPADPDVVFGAGHFGQYVERVGLQFGTAMVLVLAGGLLLVAGSFLAARSRRAFATILFIALADWLFFFSAAVQQPWTGYPRTNFIPLVCVAVALAAGVEWIASRSRSAALIAIAAVAVLNTVPLVPFLSNATRPDSARNSIEHFDAPIFFPLAATLRQAEERRLLHPGAAVFVGNNAKALYSFFYPGPVEQQYPQLAERYRLAVGSFRGMPDRCRCGAARDVVALELVRFTNFSSDFHERSSVEREAEECLRLLRSSCRSSFTVEEEGITVGAFGAGRK